MNLARWRDHIIIAALGLALGVTGIGWGLPSARRVALLGESIAKVRAELSERTSRELETRRSHAAILASQPAETVADLPRLVRRYLLFSDSPDEPLTLLALANFRPRQGDFNPRIVEYGGLHVYGTGAVMVLAHAVGFGRITGNVAHYADHPEDIARLYIAGRLLMVLYNIGIALLLYLFACEISNALCGFAASVIWLFSPLSLAFSHIINPHLPAAFFGTLAVWLSWRWGCSPNRRAWFGAAAASGAAAACALNAALVFLAPALAACFALRNDRRALARALGWATLVAVAFYLAFNPYFFANLGVLQEERTRFAQFRQLSFDPADFAAFFIVALPHALGLLGVVVAAFAVKQLWNFENLAGRALLVFAGAALLGAACLAGTEARLPLSVRFATYLVPLLCVFIALTLTSAWPRLARAVVAALIGLGLLSAVVVSMESFLTDARIEAGGFINGKVPAEATVLVPQSPGPYELPPFDFSRVQLVTDLSQPHDYEVRVEDSNIFRTPNGFELMATFPAIAPPPTPLSFSGRLVRVYRRAPVHQ